MPRQSKKARDFKKRQIQDKAKKRKLKKKNQLFNRKIDKRKYYGIGVEQKKYRETIEEAIDLNKLRDTLDKATRKESIIDDLSSVVPDAEDFLDTSILTEVRDVLKDCHEKGTRRLFDKKGEQVEVKGVNTKGAIENLMKDQRKYFKNITRDMRQSIRDKLEDGLNEGKSINDMKKDILKDAEGMKKSRAETIARSETIKASAKGTEDAMEKAGVEEVIWLATEDNRTCEECLNLHETKWEREEAPTPVQDTHPNCRCTLIADV